LLSTAFFATAEVVVVVAIVAGLFLFSGVFDLRPLLKTSENIALKMTV